jgi:uncharacterized protein DUF998
MLFVSADPAILPVALQGGTMIEHGVAITSPSRKANAEPVSVGRGGGQKVLLVCGILAAVLYVAMMQAIRYDGYTWISQTVSELSAIGAPTRPLWFWLAWVYTALVIAFGWGVWKSAGSNRPLRVVGGMILASGLLGVVWPFAPMHQRDVLAAGGGTVSDTLPIVLGFGTVLLFLLTVGFGAAAFGSRFRIYSIATIVLAFVFGALTGAEGPRISANLPTPWIGLWERINIAAYMVWVVVLAVVLLGVSDTATPAAGRGSLTGGAR